MFVFKARVLLFHFIVAVEWSEVSGDSFKKGERLAIMHKKVNFTLWFLTPFAAKKQSAGLNSPRSAVLLTTCYSKQLTSVGLLLLNFVGAPRLDFS